MRASNLVSLTSKDEDGAPLLLLLSVIETPASNVDCGDDDLTLLPQQQFHRVLFD